MMFPALIFLASSLLVTDEDQQKSMAAAAETTRISAAKECVSRAALKYSRFTNEAAAQVAEYAALSCATTMDIYSDSSRNVAFRSALVRSTALKVVEWRSQAGADGPSAYEAIERHLNENQPQ